MSAQTAFAIPLCVALAGAMASLTADAFARSTWARLVSAGSLALAAGAGLASALIVEPTHVFRHFAVGAGYSAASGLIFALGSAALLAGGGADRESEDRRGAIGGLVALAAVAASLLAASTDLITILIALEISAAASYALVAVAGTPRAHEAAMKYFIQGAVATALYILGMAACLLSGSITVDASGVAAATSPINLPAATAGVALILAALAFKLGAFPFHAWAPDAYETAPPEAAAFMASAAKVAALVATYTIVWEIVGGGVLAERSAWLVAAIAAASVVFGNFAALAQTNLARLLAYSGIAQVGYALTALVVGNGSAALMFAAGYGCAVAGAFLCVAAFSRLAPAWDGSIAGLAGFGRRAPVLSASLAVVLFSFTGIPPFFGFWGKFVIFVSAASDSRWLWLVVVGLLGSVVSFGYYGRVLRALYFEDADAAQGNDGVLQATDAANGSSATRAPRRVVVALAVILLLSGLVPLFAGFGSLLGRDPAGVFAIGALLVR